MHAYEMHAYERHAYEMASGRSTPMGCPSIGCISTWEMQRHAYEMAYGGAHLRL